MEIEKDRWKNRRRAVMLSLLFCASIITFVAIDGADTRLNETIVTVIGGVGATILIGYIFGAVQDDKNILKSLERKQ